MARRSAVTVALLASSASALDGKLYGINYDLRRGPDWDAEKCKSTETIAADLKILSTITSNVRTYSLSDCDVTGVLKSAKDLSLTVWLGVWVSEDSKVYDAEVKVFKELIAGGYIDSNIVGINVGSEAVYRGDISASEAIKYLASFKKIMQDNDISLPVSITDIADTFIQYPEMLKAGDIVTINQFPFWEKINADEGADHFDKRIQPLLKLAGDMEVVITETGWPTGGSAVNGSLASEEMCAIYLKDFCVLAEKYGWKYYYFAGFDTPYKAEQIDDVNTVESHFGIFDELGTMKPAYKSLTLTKVKSAKSLSSNLTSSLDSSSEAYGPGTVGTSNMQSSGKKADAPSVSSNTNTGNGTSQLVAASTPVILGAVLALVWSLYVTCSLLN